MSVVCQTVPASKRPKHVHVHTTVRHGDDVYMFSAAPKWLKNKTTSVDQQICSGTGSHYKDDTRRST